jgi:hypothetical protein
VRRCKECKTPIQPAAKCNLFIEKKGFCGIECATQWGKKAALSQREKAYRKETQQRRERLKTRTDYVKEAQSEFNRYIRMRDHGLPCASCGSKPEQRFGGTIDCSHYRSVGSAPHMRFNVFNAAAACVKCNRNLSGNIAELRKGLVAKFGSGIVERVESDQESRKYSIEQLKRIKKLFSKRANILKKRYNLG